MSTKETQSPVTEALRTYLAAPADANWEVVAGRMYRSLAIWESPEDLIRELTACGFTLEFDAREFTVFRNKGQVDAQAWVFSDIYEAGFWLRSQWSEKQILQMKKAGLTRPHTAPLMAEKDGER